MICSALVEKLPLISSSDVEQYLRLRELSRHLSTKLMKTIPRSTMSEIARTLDMERDGVLVLGSMDMTSVLADACLYDWIQDGKTLIEKYIDAHPASPGTDEDILLKAYARARYRLLLPTAVAPGAALYCFDALSGERLLLMDVGLSQSLVQADRIVLLATRTVPLGSYWMTTGAALPIQDKETGEALLRKLQDQKSSDDRLPAGQHSLALAIIRVCLDCGAGEYVQYEGADEEANQESEEGKVVKTARSTRSPRPVRRPAHAVSRNNPCPCGSGKKYKRCCMRQERAR